MDTEKANELMLYLLEQIKSTVEFTKEQAPEIAKELLAFGMIDQYVNIGSFLLLMLVAFFLTVLFAIVYFKNDARERYNKSEFLDCLGVVGACISGFAFFALLIISCCEIPSAIKTIYKIEKAPRVYLIEKLTKGTK